MKWTTIVLGLLILTSLWSGSTADECQWPVEDPNLNSQCTTCNNVGNPPTTSWNCEPPEGGFYVNEDCVDQVPSSNHYYCYLTPAACNGYMRYYDAIQCGGSARVVMTDPCENEYPAVWDWGWYIDDPTCQ